jgi:acid phosphatase
MFDHIARRASTRRLFIATAVGVALVWALLGGLGRPVTASAPLAAVGSTVALASASARPGAAAAGPTANPAGSAAYPATAASRANPTSGPAVAVPVIPRLRHIYVIVMENREYGTIVGNPDAPYVNGLIARYGLATNYRAVAHPSQPNYLALFSGSTQGVKDNNVHLLTGRNLGDQLTARRISWRVFAQNVPPGCFTGATAHGGADGSGTYARKHEPAISFASIARRPARCASISDFRHFSPSAARFELIVPNMCNSMHDCSTATGDAFLRTFVPRILRSPAMKGSVLFLTWDEGRSNLGGGGRIATLAIGPSVKRAYRSAIVHTHYSLLLTIERAWGLGCLNRACSATDLREFFR